MQVTNKIYNSIDLFKFFAAILVVAIHTMPFYGTESNYYFTCFCRIAVPFFFIATSFFFFRKEEPNIKAYTKRLATLYILWFIIEIPYIYIYFSSFEYPLSFRILNFLRCLIFNGTWMSSWYVMACILSVNIVYFLSYKKKWNNKCLLVICLGAYIVCLLCSSYSGLLDTVLNERWQSYHESFTWFFTPANSFMVALLYITLGKILTEEKWKKWWICQKSIRLSILCLIVLLLGVVEVYILKWSVYINDAWAFLPLLTLMGFILLLQNDVKLNPSVGRWLRNTSILVYFLHPIFRLVNSKLIGVDYGGGCFVITLFESVVFASLIQALSRQIPILKKLY